VFRIPKTLIRAMDWAISAWAGALIR
jgi:hypothetical protein